MNNTDNLLRAFIEASGYEIEEGDISAGEPIDCSCSSATYSTMEIKSLYSGKHIDCPNFGGNWIVSEPVIDYKVTKKLDKLYDGVSLDQLIRNVFELSHANHSEKWIKYPKDIFDAVVKYFGDAAINKTDTYAEIYGVDVFLLEDLDNDKQ